MERQRPKNKGKGKQKQYKIQKIQRNPAEVVEQGSQEENQTYQINKYVKSQQLSKCLFLRKIGRKGYGSKDVILFSRIPLLLSKYEIYPKLAYQQKLVYINRGTNNVYVYDFGKNDCQVIQVDRRIPTDSNNLFYHLYFYVIGGLINGKKCKDVYKYNLRGQSQQLPSLIEERSLCGLCVLKNKLYAIGGTQQKTVECLNLYINDQ